MRNFQTIEQKFRYFELLVAIGYKYIEVAFPCASQTEYDFTRRLIETPGAVPEDVTLQVIAPCRIDALQRSVECLRGARKAIVFTFLAASDNFRETNLNMSEEECLDRVTECTEFVRSLTKDNPLAQDTEWNFGLGCEDFSNARPEAVLRVAERVINAWGPTVEKPMIFGGAASVEGATPNVFADQVEYFLRHVPDRDKLLLSIHPHNDRGCAVAAAELACLAGADMVEGCLFGNGERAGNVDLVTLALNLFTQGIDPYLDFSNLPKISAIVKDITKISVPDRAPYAGKYYFRALSGAHQNAILRGFQKRDEGDFGDVEKEEIPNRQETVWRVPYLPMDPADIGRRRSSVIGITSQSGKSGVQWVLKHRLGLTPPNEMVLGFSRAVKARSEEAERELTADEICNLFSETYNQKFLNAPARIGHLNRDRSTGPSAVQQDRFPEQPELSPVSSAARYLSRLLNVEVSCFDHTSQLIDGTSNVAAFAKCLVDGVAPGEWGLGLEHDESSAYVSAMLSAVTVGSLS